MNTIFKNMLSQYSPTTKKGKDNATHEVMQSVAEVLPFRQRLRGFTKTVCCAALTYGYENQAHSGYGMPQDAFFQTIRQSTAIRIDKSAWLKAKIFITAGQRPAAEEPTNNLCLKGRTKILMI